MNGLLLLEEDTHLFELLEKQKGYQKMTATAVDIGVVVDKLRRVLDLKGFLRSRGNASHKTKVERVKVSLEGLFSASKITEPAPRVCTYAEAGHLTRHLFVLFLKLVEELFACYE